MEQNPNQKSSSTLKTWPGAFGIYGLSRDAMKRSLGTFIWIIVITVGASIVASALFHHVLLLQRLATLIISAFMLGPNTIARLAAVRGHRMELNEAMQAGGRFFGQALVLNILLVGIGILSFIALVVPFFIIMPRLVLAPYFLVDQKLDALEAIKASWRATAGNVGKVWGILGAAVVMALPVITIVGVVATVYLIFMYSAAVTLLYLYMQKHPAAANS